MSPFLRISPISELPSGAAVLRLTDALNQRNLTIDQLVFGLAHGGCLHAYQAGDVAMVDAAEWSILGDLLRAGAASLMGRAS